MTFTVAILAGGQSRRMGTDKAFVPLLGRPMIEHVLARVADLGQSNTFIVTNTPESYAYLGLPLFTDVIPGAGPLGGIYTALTYSDTPFTCVVGCDLPLASPDMLRYLLDVADEGADHYDAIVPRYQGVPQGLHALYAQRARTTLAAHITAQSYQIKAFLADVRTRFVDEPEYSHIDPEGRMFRNVNTPDDLIAVEQILRAG